MLRTVSGMGNWIHTHWHLIHWGDAPAYLGMVVTTIFGLLSWCSSRRSKKSVADAKIEADRAERATTAAEEAAASAERSAAAAERSASAGERSATADETQARLLQSQADAAEAKPWDLDRPSQSQIFLVNRTNTPKYNVVVTGEPADAAHNPHVFGGGGRNRFEEFDGNDRRRLKLLTHAAPRDRLVIISWHPTADHTGEPWTQHRGLPS